MVGSEADMTRRFDRAMTPEELLTMPEEDIDLTDVPELDDSIWSNAQVRRPADSKSRLALEVDEEVVAWFRSLGPGHEARMSAVLRAFYEARSKHTFL